MTIRALKLPRDLVPLEKMIFRAFQYPENPDWSIQADEEEEIGRELKTLRRIWPVIRTLQILSPSLKDLIRGFVWEEEGQIGGIVAAQRQGTTDAWGIGVVGVLPEFRRRGIARKLLTRTLDDLKARSAQRIVLGVIEKNVPAYSLYTSLGFNHYSSLVEFNSQSGEAPEELSLPAGFEEAPLSRSDWKSRYMLEQRITPEDVTQYEPLEIGRFRPPLARRTLEPVMDRLQRAKKSRFLYQKSGSVVGLLTHLTSGSGKGTSSISAQLDPAQGELAPYLLAKAMRALLAINPTLRIQFTVPVWMAPLEDAARDLGFTERVRYHMLGLIP